MSSLKDRYVKQCAMKLAEEGGRLVRKAFQTAQFDKNQTQNLADSYGSAVYYNGKMVQGTMYLMTSRAVQGRYNYYRKELEYGRNEIVHYLNNYKPTSKGFELVTAAAMFYAKILEDGKGLRRKYRVITGITADMDALAAKTGGKVVDINL